MVNKKKDTPYLDSDAVITAIASRAGFTKGDVKTIFMEFKNLLEECVVSGIDVDLNGILHMEVVDIIYTKPPGIVAHWGNTEFKKHTKKINFKVPLNFKEALKKSMEAA